MFSLGSAVFEFSAKVLLMLIFNVYENFLSNALKPCAVIKTLVCVLTAMRFELVTFILDLHVDVLVNIFPQLQHHNCSPKNCIMLLTYGF